MGVRDRVPSGGIVVGVRDGGSAHGAVIWAALQARARGLPLIVCHAYEPGTQVGPELECAAHNRAWRTARDAVRLAETEAPGVVAFPSIVRGSPARALTSVVADPALIVVGFRSRGRTAAELVTRIWYFEPQGPICPVVVVPSQRKALRRLCAARRRRIGWARRSAPRPPFLPEQRGERKEHAALAADNGAGSRVVVATATGLADGEVLRFATSEARLWGSRVLPLPTAPGTDKLPALCKDACLLVIGKPVSPHRSETVAAQAVRTADGNSSTYDSECTARAYRTGDRIGSSSPTTTLEAVLGYGAIRRLDVPLAVVPELQEHKASRAGPAPTGGQPREDLSVALSRW